MSILKHVWCVCVATHTHQTLCCSSPTYLSTQNTTHTHHTLCCRITTINFYKFWKKLSNSV